MSVIRTNTSATFVENDGSDTDWRQLPITGYQTFPYSVKILISDVEWIIECYVIPGRYNDKLITHILKGNDQGLFDPVLDYCLQTGVEIVIDDKIRIYGTDIGPNLKDNYETEQVYGIYSIGVAEVK